MAKTTCGHDNFMGCAYEQPCPEHVQRDWAGQKLVSELQEAVRGQSYATAHSPQEEWDSLLADVRSRFHTPDRWRLISLDAYDELWQANQHLDRRVQELEGQVMPDRSDQ